MALPALIFDCDGVLVDSERLASQVEAEAARELGLALTIEEAHDLFLGQTIEAVVDTIAARWGQRPSATFVYQWAFATAHAFMRDLKPVPFVYAALEEFKRRGHALAVASQSPLARVCFSLHIARFDRHFGAHVYVTSMVARPKPAADIYLHAAAGLGVAPADCIVIEDSPGAAAAAVAAGMQAIVYAPGRTAEAPHTGGASVIRSMDELVACVDALGHVDAAAHSISVR